MPTFNWLIEKTRSKARKKKIRDRTYGKQERKPPDTHFVVFYIKRLNIGGAYFMTFAEYLTSVLALILEYTILNRVVTHVEYFTYVHPTPCAAF